MAAVTQARTMSPRPETRAETRTVTILGRELRIRSDESLERVQALARYVDAKAQEVAPAGKPGATQAAEQHVLLVTALSLADEIFKLRAEHEALLGRLRDSSRQLLGRIAPSLACEPDAPELAKSEPVRPDPS